MEKERESFCVWEDLALSSQMPKFNLCHRLSLFFKFISAYEYKPYSALIFIYSERPTATTV